MDFKNHRQTNVNGYLSRTLKHQFGFKHPLFEPIESGEENQNYKVILPHHQYLLRVYSAEHSTTDKRLKSQIEQEHRFIEHLANQGGSTPLPIKNDMGHHMIEAYAPYQQERLLLKTLLKARFLYDMGAYIYNDLETLVDELLADQSITSLVLD